MLETVLERIRVILIKYEYLLKIKILDIQFLRVFIRQSIGIDDDYVRVHLKKEILTPGNKSICGVFSGGYKDYVMLSGKDQMAVEATEY